MLLNSPYKSYHIPRDHCIIPDAVRVEKKAPMPFDVSVLTEKQRLFCEEYLIDCIGSQAAIRAGYSPDSSRSEASRLLTNSNVRAYIRELMDNRSKDTLIDAIYVLESLKDVAERCRQAVPVMRFNPITSRMEQVKDDEDRDVWEFDSQGANKALELIGKHIGVFEKDNSQKKPETSIVIPDKVSKAIDKLLDEAV